MFIASLIRSTPTVESGDNAWIGATDTDKEGTFSWIGPHQLGNLIMPFFMNGMPIQGSFTNWGEGEPNPGGTLEDGWKDEDCVAKDGNTNGQWKDLDCYEGAPFFVVEFGQSAYMQALAASEN